MAMFKGFSNAFKIPELRKKILITLGLVAVCRLVSYIPVPGVDWVVIQKALAEAMARAAAGTQSNDAAGVIFNFLQTATGGATSNCAIGFLSIWPYISAQIVIQLLTSVIPYLSKLRKEGESGRQQIGQITRYLTIVICLVQSAVIGYGLIHAPGNISPAFAGYQVVANPGFGFILMTMITMTATALFVMWVADQITTFGVGNGGSLIIMINITSRLPEAIMTVWDRYFGATSAGNNPIELVLLLLFGFLVVMGTVMLTQGVRKVVIHSTRRSVGGGNSYGMQQTYMPLRVNYTGVMPIIFAGPLLSLPAVLLSKLEGSNAVTAWLKGFGEQLGRTDTVTHMIIYGAFILFFAFFWVASQFNAVEISENLKKDGSYIPGIRPGRATAEYLDALMTRITLIGGVGLLVIALLPEILMSFRSIPWVIASFFGGTSLLIIVGVALDTLRIMESHLLVRKYDGFLRHGTLRGRGGM